MFRSHAGDAWRESFPRNSIRVDPSEVEAIAVVAEELGYWSALVVDLSRDIDVTLQPLPSAGPLGWWHDFHGVQARMGAARGAGVRVGVVDEALAAQQPGSCIAHVTNLFDQAWGGPPSNRAATPRVEHGRATTSLIGSRCGTAGGYDGMAPGAEILFSAAGADHGPALAVPRVANGIDCLVLDHQCDLVSVSAGDFAVPVDAIRNAVERAWENGALCFFAAGNQGGAPLYPARYPRCLAVAAVGKIGFAPATSAESLQDSQASVPVGTDFYLWGNSASGPGVDFIAAGSNVIWSDSGRAARAVSGTSFACPIAVGIAAVILGREHAQYAAMPRDAARSARMLEILTNHADASYPALAGHGLLRL